MPKTAYSKYYKSELDVGQLLAKISGESTPKADLDLSTVPTAIRDWIRNDAICPCCGQGGAHIVVAATGKRGTVLRQNHFRFVRPDGSESHHPCCEFHHLSQKDGASVELVDFSASKSRETRIVRELVCKGVTHGVFSQEDMREMRQWFFDTKVASLFTVETAVEDITWLESLRSNHSNGIPFQPWHGQMPDYDWKTAATVEFSHRNRALLAQSRTVPITESTRRKARRLVEKWHGQTMFDVTVLEHEYQQCLSLCMFMSRNLPALGYNAVHMARLQYDDVNASLLAFCALLLFVSDWEIEVAVTKLAYLVNAEVPADLTLGNIIGLNPFQDYFGWRVVMLAGQLGKERPPNLDYSGVLSQIEAGLRQAHRQWVVSQNA